MSKASDKSITLCFEGYWQCRQATDPDPSRDPRGSSGYTYAVGAENDLDQIIRLQLDEIAQFNPDWYHPEDNGGRPLDYRESWPAPKYPDSHALSNSKLDDNDPRKFGVFISDVTATPGFPTKKLANICQTMKGGKIRFLPNDSFNEGPRFELRNTITYYPANDDAIFMPIDPFEIQAESNTPDGKAPEIIIRRDDPLDLKKPNKQIWQIGDPTVYAPRCPVNFIDVADQALVAVGLDPTDPAGSSQAFYQQRKEWLQLELTQVETSLQNARDEQETQTLLIRRDALKNRLYAINFFTGDAVNNRMETRPAMLAQWDFPIRGSKSIIPDEKLFGIKISTRRDWKTRFWMGGFDGDTMRGYMRGSLSLPVE